MIMYSQYQKGKLWIAVYELTILLYYVDNKGTHVENVNIDTVIYSGMTLTVPSSWSKKHPLVSSIVKEMLIKVLTDD